METKSEKTSAPKNRRKFTDAEDEIDYLSSKIIYWFCEYGSRSRAFRFIPRFETLVRKTCSKDGLLYQGYWVMLYWIKGNIQKAIQHQELETELIKKMLSIQLPKGIKKHCNYNYLSLSYNILGSLYYESGNIETAIETLKKSKLICKNHNIPFIGKDQLNLYIEETKG